MSELKRIREKNRVTQKYCADLLGISLRSYKDYENNEKKTDTFKYRYLVEKMQEYFAVNEEKGLLSIDKITEIVQPILKEYGVYYCYLFGSYAKKTAKEDSDVDLLIASSCKGLRFYELAEILREKLKKKVDLLSLSQLIDNQELLNDILQTGIKIYG